jgi:hypothetical protein
MRLDLLEGVRTLQWSVSTHRTHPTSRTPLTGSSRKKALSKVVNPQDRRDRSSSNQVVSLARLGGEARTLPASGRVAW